MDPQLWWYVARGSGIVAWAMMAVSIFWGLALSSRFLGRNPKPSWMLDLHRFLGGASVVFVAVHVLSLVLDSYVHFGWLEVLVPGASTYRTLAVAGGVIGLYLLAAVQVTSMLRKHLSKRAWRMTHMASYPLFAVSTLHLLGAGTDAPSLILRPVVVAAVVGILAATIVRMRTGLSSTTPVRGRPARTAVTAARFDERERVIVAARSKEV